MRRSLCITEPKYVRVGTIGTIKFIYTPSANLPKGTLLRFDPLSKGRQIDWQQPQTQLKTKSNLIWLTTPSGKQLAAKSSEKKDSISLVYDFTLDEDVPAGDEIHIYMGTPDKTGHEKKGNKPQQYIERRRCFNLYVDPKGKGIFRDPEVFTLDVRGGDLDHIRALHPSLVGKNQRFDVIIRFEDEYNNPTSKAPEGTLIELGYEQLRENLNWKLFVPETGFLTLPNFYFNEPGIYKLKLKNLATGEEFLSSPIKCVAAPEETIYWGVLRGESERYDSRDDIESCLRYFRDEKAYQFFSTSHFENDKPLSPPVWKGINAQVGEFNEDDRFSTLLGFSYIGTNGSEGLRHMIYAKDNKPLLKRKDPKSSTLKKIYKSHNPKDLISIPTLTMGGSHHFDFKNFAPDFERVVEIYNAWGSSECAEKEGNLRPIHSTNKIQSKIEGSVRTALNQNHRFGFVAGGLDDRGVFEGLFDSDQKQYSPGLTAIVSAAHTRDQLIKALYARRCYATTGARILIDVQLAGLPMGSEISTKTKPGLAYNRHLSGTIAGTDTLKEVTFFRNGKAIKTFKPNNDLLEFAFDDGDPIQKVELKSPDSRPPFVYYYVRVVQKDGHIGWGSPIWVDHEENSKPATAGSKKK